MRGKRRRAHLGFEAPDAGHNAVNGMLTLQQHQSVLYAANDLLLRFLTEPFRGHGVPKLREGKGTRATVAKRTGTRRSTGSVEL